METEKLAERENEKERENSVTVDRSKNDYMKSEQRWHTEEMHWQVLAHTLRHF